MAKQTKTDKQKQYEAELMQVITEKKICFFDHCFAFVSFTRATAYNHDLDKFDSIKNAIANNRITAKTYMLNKWINSDNQTLQLAAYRLLSESEEHRKLNQQYMEQKNVGESKVQIITKDEATKNKFNDIIDNAD